MKRAKVFLNDVFAGTLTENDMGYEFRYAPDYLKSDNAVAVSLTLPLTDPVTGISLGVNVFNALVVGILGVPGLVLLLLVQWVLT